MKTFRFLVDVEAETPEQALQVMYERLDHYEDTGFEHTIGYDLVEILSKEDFPDNFREEDYPDGW